MLHGIFQQITATHHCARSFCRQPFCALQAGGFEIALFRAKFEGTDPSNARTALAAARWACKTIEVIFDFHRLLMYL